MAAIDDIDITSLLFQEGAAPSTPASTKWRLYFKTDGIYVKDDAGTETGPLAGGGSSGSLTFVETVTLGAGGTITFDAIAATGKDLLIRGRVRDDAAAAFTNSLQMQVGATSVDSGTNYNYATQETRVGNATAGDAATGATTMFVARSIMGDSAAAGLYTPVEILIQDYASTTVFKVVKSSWTTYHATDSRIGQATGHWLDSDTAIDIVTISGASGGNLVTGSSLSLWLVND